MRSVARVTDFEQASKRARSCARAGLPRRLALVTALFLGLIAAGCAHPAHTARPPVAAPPAQPSPRSGPPPPIERQPVVPGEYVEEGVASWYGNPFDGRRTSNGDIYDMHAFTAAHRTLPFGAVVRVTNLGNGHQTEVRINDRGPFVANRIIDLSLSAAQAIGMVGTGTAQVRIEVIAGPNPRVGFFGVQVGAFRMQDNADRLRAQLAANYAPVSIATYDSPSGLFYRVRAGRLPTEDAAGRLAEELRSREHLTTFVVRLDE
ncbi:MAG: septal ring lytic transglycosylase RlpA family protein [Acidobacteriia bacterium]|nr:septal ring lytic transglycosylase RlpA family protein [Terriglobia bacterium]